MTNRTVIAADIAKTNFQCVQFKAGQQVGKNRNFKRTAFAKLISADKPIKLIMETCSGAQHWARLAKNHGHEVVLIPPKVVSGYRHGQKTDANDALAIYEASRRPHLKASVHKSVDIQALECLESVRSHYQTRKVRLSNAIRGHLGEFGLVMPKGYRTLRTELPLILEDAENGLPILARTALAHYWSDWQAAHHKVLELDKSQREALAKNETAKEILKIVGVGPVCATGLLCKLGDAKAFGRSKEAAAFIGTAPKQHSSGGKEVMIGISKKSGHKQLRAALIQGARSVILALKKKDEPGSDLERWLSQLVERLGDNRAAVALANKNVRIAWALIAHDRPYQVH